MSEDVENIDPTGTIRGRDNFRQFIEVFKVASPDARLEARNVIEDGPRAVIEGVFTGTFTGPLRSPQGEVPPNGKSFELPFAEINEVKDGKVKSHRVYYDQVAFMTALGLMPAQGA